MEDTQAPIGSCSSCSLWSSIGSHAIPLAPVLLLVPVLLADGGWRTGGLPLVPMSSCRLLCCLLMMDGGHTGSHRFLFLLFPCWFLCCLLMVDGGQAGSHWFPFLPFPCGAPFAPCYSVGSRSLWSSICTHVLMSAPVPLCSGLLADDGWGTQAGSIGSCSPVELHRFPCPPIGSCAAC